MLAPPSGVELIRACNGPARAHPPSSQQSDPVVLVLRLTGDAPARARLGDEGLAARAAAIRGLVRRYDNARPVPAEVVERLLAAAVRAPSAGFSQGWGFLVLDTAEDVSRFRDAVTPKTDADKWFGAQVRAPLIIVPHSNKDTYLDNYARPEKGLTDRSEAWWPAPYWDIDTGFAALLILLAAVDEGLGACFFGIPKERIDPYRDSFGVPPSFRPIGAISIGYPDEPPRDFSAGRRPLSDVVHRGHWNVPD